jgi:hypothetical protein
MGIGGSFSRRETTGINKDVIEAAKNLVMMDLALLSAEIANGMYTKPPDVLAKEFRYDPLPDEVRTVIITSWKRGGLLPASVVEQMVPAALDIPSQPSGEQNRTVSRMT